jgi:hypothetical protein
LSKTGTVRSSRWDAHHESVHHRSLRKTRPVHDPACAGSRARRGRRGPGAKRGQARPLKDQITVIPGATNNREVIERAVAGCEGELVVLVPRGVHQFASGTAQAVLDYGPPGARLVFSCRWHITLDGQDVYSWKIKALVKVAGPLARLVRFADLDDQVEACRRVFASGTRWTVVRGSDLEEGESQGLPVWSQHVGDPILKSNLTRRVDFALFMVAALENNELIHEARRSLADRPPPRSHTPPANDSHLHETGRFHQPPG